ncbi:MAG: hypothetical protein GY810_19575 [Aureispira sp.]|nr:hypothetical protein [Aureispira sp.]
MKNIIQYITLGCLVFCFQQNAFAQINPSDGCAAPNALPVNPGCTNNNYTLAGSFSNGGVTNASCATAGNDRDDGWYQFTATATTTNIDVTGDEARALAVFTACPSVGIAAELGCDIQAAGTTTSVSVATTIGVTYYVQIHRRSGNNSATMTGTICIYSTPSSGNGSDCANADPLTPGTQQCGTNSSAGDFPDAGGAPSNPCNSSYNDGEYWFSYTGTGDGLQLDVSGLTATYSGLFVLDACPAGTPNCIASYTSGSSSANFTLSTPALTLGQTYFIVLANWSSPYQTDFCLDATPYTPPPPPANDDCLGATAVTVNPDLACGSVTSGTVQNSTPSSQDASVCFGTEDDDVWFSFVATGPNHTIDIQNIAGSTTDMYHSVWEGACPTLSLVAGSCSDANSSTLFGLTPGNTYYIRVYTYTSTGGQTSTFDVCVGTPPPPPVNQSCAGALCTDGAVTISAVSGGPDADVVNPGNDYGCLSSQPNPYWYYLQVDAAGNIDMSLTAGSDIDFAIWGPFADVAAAQAACNSYGAPIDCNYASTSTEAPSIPTASAGDVYVMLITNFADINQTITLSQSGGTGSASCTIIPCNADAGGW